MRYCKDCMFYVIEIDPNDDAEYEACYVFPDNEIDTSSLRPACQLFKRKNWWEFWK